MNVNIPLLGELSRKSPMGVLGSIDRAAACLREADNGKADRNLESGLIEMKYGRDSFLSGTVSRYSGIHGAMFSSRLEDRNGVTVTSATHSTGGLGGGLPSGNITSVRQTGDGQYEGTRVRIGLDYEPQSAFSEFFCGPNPAVFMVTSKEMDQAEAALYFNSHEPALHPKFTP